MANFYDNFSGGLDNWIMSSATPIERSWYSSNGLLKVESNTNDFGLIRAINPIDVDIDIVAEYNSLDIYNGIDNLIVFRYTDNSHFNFISIDVGSTDSRGVVFGFDEFVTSSAQKIPMYNISGVLLDDESIPNITVIPQTGKATLSCRNNKYDVVLYDLSNAFVASGSFLDPLYKNINSGYFGFAHTNRWDAGITGWISIDVSDYAIIPEAPTITSFSATDYVITPGDTSTIGWKVNRGTELPTVYLGTPVNAFVPLEGTMNVSPAISSTYSLSAWNNAGSDYKELQIDINFEVPYILSYYNNGPINAGNSATLYWDLSGATSAYINNEIGWIPNLSASQSGFAITDTLYTDKTYTLDVYNYLGAITTDTTTILVQEYPSCDLYISGSPVCSAGEYYLIWDSFNATSAVINNGIGDVALSGTMAIPATTSKSYSLTVYNSAGSNVQYANATVYHRPPIAYAGSDVSAYSIDGNPVSVTLDGSMSYDPDGFPLSYKWYNGITEIYAGAIFTSAYPVGTHNLSLNVSDPCNMSASDTISVVIVSNIPPVVNLVVSDNYLSSPAPITLDGSGSYDPDGVIVEYKWYDNDVYISNASVFNYNVDYGIHDIVLKVIDDQGNYAFTHTTVFVDVGFLPIANAGDDQKICDYVGNSIILDGSKSSDPLYPADSKIVWYEWQLTDFGLPNISNVITSKNEISATINNVSTGIYSAPLVVSADNGFTNTDIVYVSANSRPILMTSPDIITTLQNGEITTDIVLSADSNSTNAIYVWEYTVNNIVDTAYTPTINLTVPKGNHYADVYAFDIHTLCKSDTHRINIDILDGSVDIIDFNADKFVNISYTNDPVNISLSYSVNNATDVYINGVIQANPVSGVYPISIAYPGGLQEFVISATDGVYMRVSTIYGNFLYAQLPLIACTQRNGLIVSYGVDEIRYGADKYLDLTRFLPDYLKQTETNPIVQQFSEYLNNMYDGQRNFTWNDDTLTTYLCDTQSCYMEKEKNTYFFDGTSATFSTSGIYDPYEITVKTPSRTASSIFIDNICNTYFDSISIMDKINRITDMMSPDLIPIDIIQHYADNLGYQAGINRNALIPSGEETAKELIQNRYLRFMVRSLPEWYQIKTTHASIAVMLFSFGLIGDFVYYYTRFYSDKYSRSSIADGLYKQKSFKKLATMRSRSVMNVEDFVPVCNIIDINEKGYLTDEDVAANRCCAKKYYSNNDASSGIINDINGVTSFNDWILTDATRTSIYEDLTPVVEAERVRENYFSTPHFMVMVSLDQSSGNYSTDLETQKMIRASVESVKPVNTVFDGVIVSVGDNSNNTSVMLLMGKCRIRKSMKIISESTFLP